MAICVFIVLLYLLDEKKSIQAAANALVPNGHLLIDIPNKIVFQDYQKKHQQWIVLYLYLKLIRMIFINTWIQLVSATVNEVLVLKKTSWGVRKSKVFLGRWLSLSMACLISALRTVVSSRCFGKYWRIRPLVFSFSPRCHEA